MADDIVIKVMPKEFLGKEASLGEPAKQTTTAPVIPVAVPVVPLPVVAPPVAQPSKPVGTLPATSSTPIKKRSRGGLIAVILVVLLALGGIGGYFYWQSMQTVTPEPIPEPIPEPECSLSNPCAGEFVCQDSECVPAPEPEPVTPQPGRDTDSDGLTDVEESLYRTDFRNPDTDADSYLDGNEVFHFYDPLTGDSTNLATTLTEFQNSTSVFIFYYPAAWTVTEVNGLVIIDTPTGETFTLTRTEMVGQQPTIENSDLIISRTEGNMLIVWQYNLNDAPTIEYRTTFQMVADSYSELIDF